MREGRGNAGLMWLWRRRCSGAEGDGAVSAPVDNGGAFGTGSCFAGHFAQSGKCLVALSGEESQVVVCMRHLVLPVSE